MKKVLLATATIYVFGGVRTLDSEKAFTRAITHNKLTAILFYAGDNEESLAAFKAVSATAPYKNGAIKFYSRAGDVTELALYRNGVLYTHDLLHAPFDQKQIEHYLQENFGEFIKRSLEQPPYIFYTPPYNNYCYNPYWYWDWPYGYYNWGYGGYARPVIGFGFTVGV